MKYGPNTAEIEELIDHVRNLTPEQVERLGAAWDAARDAIRGAAWYAAWGAAWGAVMARLVKDLISEEDFVTLYGPWRSVMN